MPWYNGPTLLEALDKCTPPQRPIDKPIRVPPQCVYRIGGIGTVLVGRVATGVLKAGMTASFAHADVTGEVASIERHNQFLSQALPGGHVGFHVKNVPLKSIRRGDVASNAHHSPAASVLSFEAQVVVMNHPGQISIGYTPIMYCHTAHVSCRFQHIHQKLDRRTGQVLEENPKFI